jgi:hypothetical protein
LSTHGGLSFLPLAEEAEQHLKQIDKIEIKGKCSHYLKFAEIRSG